MSLVCSGILRPLPPGTALGGPAEALCVPLTSRKVVVGRNRGGAAGKGESPKLGRVLCPYEGVWSLREVSDGTGCPGRLDATPGTCSLGQNPLTSRITGSLGSHQSSQNPGSPNHKELEQGPQPESLPFPFSRNHMILPDSYVTPGREGICRLRPMLNFTIGWQNGGPGTDLISFHDNKIM